MEELESQPQDARPNKEVVKRFRATAAEVKKMKEKAAKAGLTFSEYCRRSALDKPVVERVPPELRQHIIVVGNHLHHLTRLATAGQLSGARVEALNEVVNRLLQTLK